MRPSPSTASVGRSTDSGTIPELDENLPAGFPRMKGETAPLLVPPWIFTASMWKVFVLSIGVGLSVFAITAGSGFWLLRRGFSPHVMIISSDVVAGLLAGLLYFTVIRAHRRRRAMVIHRLKVIAAMNHHVRNALEVIVLSVGTKEHSQNVELIHGATTRITWALREILGSKPRHE